MEKKIVYVFKGIVFDKENNILIDNRKDVNIYKNRNNRI